MRKAHEFDAAKYHSMEQRAYLYRWTRVQLSAWLLTVVLPTCAAVYLWPWSFTAGLLVATTVWAFLATAFLRGQISASLAAIRLEETVQEITKPLGRGRTMLSAAFVRGHEIDRIVDDVLRRIRSKGLPNH